MIKIKNKVISTAAIILLLTFTPGLSGTEEIGINEGGEKMTFEVRWAFVVAGEVTLEFLPGEQLYSTRVNHYRYKARTSEFVDLFYKVRDTIESYTDADLNRSIIYRKKHRGKSTKNITVTFNWDRETAQHTINGNSMPPIEISPDTFDPLSVFYAFRSELSDDNKEMKINLTDGKRYITAVTKIVKKETIQVAGTKYNTILVEPRMEGVGGVFQKTKNARLRIWITDDTRRIPVRIKSKVSVGSFVADLVDYKGSYSVESN
ncbi:DUF3108 domain-containing protein [Thermodesulfobacteriota bacterium]